MATLMKNIEQSIQDFNSIKQAIINKGIEVPDGTKTSEYGNLINKIFSLSIEKVLFEGMSDTYKLADGFTGFTSIYSNGKNPGSENVITQGTGQGTLEQYGYRLSKGYSISASETYYTDSAVFCSNEKIDFTNYNMICCDFYGYCDQTPSNLTADERELMAAYFKIGEPSPVVSNTAYNWSEWSNMYMSYLKKGRYYYDISNITGEHFISFGVWHGKYSTGYTNGIKIYKLFLI